MKPSKTLSTAGFGPKVTASHSEQEPRHIPQAESDALTNRITEVVGSSKVSWFARECGFGESLLRKYLAGAQPNALNLVAIANAAGVTVDWLATGRPPKTRAELRAAAQPASSGPENALKAALQLAEDKIAAGQLTPRLAAAARAAAPAWRKAASNNPALEERLESLLATLDFLQAADGE